MGTFKDLEDARAYFEAERFATGNGMVLEALGDGTATCSMIIEPRHLNANNGVMGGAIFTLADFAFAAAANHRHRPTVALQVSINFMSLAKGKTLYAAAHCVKDGRTTCVYNVDVTDDTGRAVAQFVGTGYKS